MKELWLRWMAPEALRQNPLPALLAAAVLFAAVWCVVSACRARRLRRRLEEMEERLESVGERAQSGLKENRESLQSSLGELKGDLVRVMGDLVRLQKEQSGEINRRLSGQEAGAQSQADRLAQMDERLSRRLDASDRRLSQLCEQSNLPAKTDGADLLAQGLRLVTEQLKVMSAQLEALERAQTRPSAPAAPPDEALIVPAPESEAALDPSPDVSREEARQALSEEPPRYENTSWD